MRLSFLVLLFLIAAKAFSQNTDSETAKQKKTLPPPMIAVDSLYREDQFYVGFTYNLLLDTPDGVSQNKFSSGFTGGFLRDMPINKKRTIAIATGLGVTYNKYFENLFISNVGQTAQYSIIASGTQYEKNKYDQILIDVPLEFRWRTSTPESHKFWRIYSGFRFSYLALGKSRYVDSNYNIQVTGNNDLNKIQVGAYLSWGYNTWNFYGYYGLTPLFKSSAKLNGQSVGMNSLNLGLMFYIL
ncbi:MAG TPA: porin family protein [Flavobacterium sp.]|nr:porin family protein [Flavobacterium sp.]